MATVNVEITRVAANTSTGTQDITVAGFGTVTFFTVKVFSATTDDVEGSSILLSSSFCDGTNSVSSSIASQDASANANTARRQSSTLISAVGQTGGGNVDFVADFDSFITDGVRINITTAPSSAYLMEFTFFNGDGILNATAGSLLFDALGDSVNVGYEPTFAIVESVGNNAINNGNVHNIFSHGIAVNDGSNSQSSFQFFDEDNTSTSDSGTYYDPNSVVGQYFNGTQAWAANAVFNTTGWTWTGTEGNDYIVYLAVQLAGDINFSFESFDIPTTTGNAILGATTFTPNFAAICLSSNTATGATSNAGNGFGIYNDNGGYGSSYHSVDAVTTTDCKTISSLDKIIVQSSTNTSRYEGSLVGFNSTGIEFNFTTVDATARKGFGLFIGNPVTGGINVTASFDVTDLYLGSTGVSTQSNAVFINNISFGGSVDTDITSLFNGTVTQDLLSNTAIQVGTSSTLTGNNDYNSSADNNIAGGNNFTVSADITSSSEVSVTSLSDYSITNAIVGTTESAISSVNVYDTDNIFQTLISVTATGDALVTANFSILSGYGTEVINTIDSESSFNINNLLDQQTSNSIETISVSNTDSVSSGDLLNGINTTTGLDTSLQFYNSNINFIETLPNLITVTNNNVTLINDIVTGSDLYVTNNFSTFIIVGDYNPILSDKITAYYITTVLDVNKVETIIKTIT